MLFKGLCKNNIISFPKRLAKRFLFLRTMCLFLRPLDTRSHLNSSSSCEKTKTYLFFTEKCIWFYNQWKWQLRITSGCCGSLKAAPVIFRLPSTVVLPNLSVYCGSAEPLLQLKLIQMIYFCNFGLDKLHAITRRTN